MEDKTNFRLGRRAFLQTTGMATVGGLMLGGCQTTKKAPGILKIRSDRPNILFILADDWSGTMCGAYGDVSINTPNIDALVNDGVLFKNAFCSVSSCSPARSEIISGEKPWKSSEYKNGSEIQGPVVLSGGVPPREDDFYPKRLKAAGYVMGYAGKGNGPPRNDGKNECDGRTHKSWNIQKGSEHKGFLSFLNSIDGKPFCFWLGSRICHIDFKKQYQGKIGEIPPFFPDVPEVRQDLNTYYGQIERFDFIVGEAVKALKERGLYDNTIILVTGDNGIPFPRCKAQAYEWSCHVPMVAAWKGGTINPGKVIEDFVEFGDIAPTFLTAAGLGKSPEMTGSSFLDIFGANQSTGYIDASRNRSVWAFERQASSLPYYPIRTLRTPEYVYIRNLDPDGWPMGSPYLIYGPDFPNEALRGKPLFPHADNTKVKEFLVKNYDNPEYQKYNDWCFGRRPAEELYDVQNDPFCLNNIAGNNPEICKNLWCELRQILVKTEDFRARAGEFDDICTANSSEVIKG